MNKIRVTQHQRAYLEGMFIFKHGEDSLAARRMPMNPKSWINKRGVRVWNFAIREGSNVIGDCWDTQTGESLLKKGLIEPSFSMKHDGKHYAPPGHYRFMEGKEIQFYRLTPLAISILNKE